MTKDPGSQAEDPYAEIRPYSNAEAPAVLRRLARDPELVATIASWRLAGLSSWWPALAHVAIRCWLFVISGKLHSVEDLQNLIAPNLSRMIKRTSRFTISGLEDLDLRRFRVYLSNHRDIVMDPAYASYAMHRAGATTLAVAIGDNLLSKPWVADLMRLNKSFIVKRNLGGPRALLAATKLLSSFISASVRDHTNPIWIAHREGRAKDGRDLTEPAVIKMLTLCRARDESPEVVLDVLSIVPLVISYELDPCDALKAAELSAGAGYTKSQFEDISSIARGITGQKGCVHLHFGKSLQPGLDVAGAVAAIDQQIADHYELYQTNVWAWQWLYGAVLPAGIDYSEGSITEASFRARIDDVPSEHREWLLAMYANPVNRAAGLPYYLKAGDVSQEAQCD
ncbi:MAG: 1-acyl-sn-glycerol-3-phosphate acyltransferase [Luminiphilus sp.]|nr:1-acyl-sn-glycerol-3-phosphate acyltransferase [Luminiphilus sp.]